MKPDRGGDARRAAKAGAVYFLVVFACGFALGALRTIVITPRIGDTAAVAVESPVMLAISWYAAGAFVRRFAVRRWPAAALMGALAFALLMGAEFILGLALGVSLRESVMRWLTPGGALGLAGQALFALFPIFRRRS
ncbi:MAG: hypothetical protein R3C60_00495 [Parvularculaceae bacterium]